MSRKPSFRQLSSRTSQLITQEQYNKMKKKEQNNERRKKKEEEQRNKLAQQKRIKSNSNKKKYLKSLDNDSFDVIEKLKNKINDIFKEQITKPEELIEKLDKCTAEVYKAYGAVDEVCVLTKKAIEELERSNKTEVINKIKKYISVIISFQNIIEVIKEIRNKKIKKYLEILEKIQKMIEKLPKKDNIVNKLNSISKSIFYDSEATVLNNIEELKKIVNKRLKTSGLGFFKSFNMIIPPKELKNIKNKDHGLEAMVDKLKILFKKNNEKIIEPIFKNLNKPSNAIRKIKEEIITQTGGSKKSIKINSGNIHKYLNVPKSYKFRKSSIERINKVKLNEYFTFRKNRYKMTKIIKKNINLANSFLNN